MKKHQIFTYGAVLALSMGTVSCGDDFLTVQPASSVSVDGYYTTKAHIDEAVVAAYDPMHWFDYFGGWSPLNLVADCQGDDIYVGGGSTADQGELHLLNQYAATPTSTQTGQYGAWKTCYSGINRSNLVIADAENAPAGALTDKERQQYIDEAKTTRSFYYLILWKWWGNVPYYEENLSFPYIAEQKTATEVYEGVIATLDEVIANGALPMRESNERAGHATMAFAKMLYSDFVMYQKDQSRYGQALTYMKDIINSGQYKLMNDFYSIWLEKNEWCDESIFEINFFSEGGTRDWGAANSPGGTVLPAMIGIDGLNDETGYYDGGWGFCTVSKEVYDQYEANDKRKDTGILNIDKYISDHAAEGKIVSYGGRYQNTGLFLNKYLPVHNGNHGYKAADALNWGNNLRFYRYSETLLNAAELAMRTGDNTAAQVYMDQVRSRAGLAPVGVTEESLLNERRLEFVGEGKRYFDLIRFGKAAEVLKAGGGKVLNADKTAYDQTGVPQRPNWTESKKYLPIPQAEVDAAQGTITQNPY